MTSSDASPSASPLLEVRGVGREYPTPREPLVVLSGVDLSLARGESIAIMGPSGSGKSTLLHILGTLDRPTSGTVRLSGVDPFSLAPQALAAFRNKNVGFVFQEHYLLPQLTALENVLVPTFVGARDGAASEARARELLAKVGLADRASHRPSELSGGERQRAAIARALINDPQLLLCDEPSGNLDRKTAAAIGDLFGALEREGSRSFVVVTHDASFAARFGRRFDLADGRLVPADAA